MKAIGHAAGAEANGNNPSHAWNGCWPEAKGNAANGNGVSVMARMLGVRANGVILLAFAISGMLAAAIGLILATNSGTADIGMGANLMLIAFIATVIGGLGSVPGAVAAGFLIGGASVVFQATLPHDARVFRDAFVYGAVIVVLLVRPQGLFAPKSAKQRV